MNNNIISNKKILITGHTGFKGSWLSVWLNLLGADVIGMSNNIPTKPAHYDLLESIFIEDHVVNINEAEHIYF